jgi:cytochrome c oxidase subunit 2
VSGTPAGGIVGPELSHLATRATLAAGTIPNDAAHLSTWIADPAAIKPGVLMPKVPMTPAQRAQIVAYLQSLV